MGVVGGGVDRVSELRLRTGDGASDREITARCEICELMRGWNELIEGL
jgi:hypothetical protein